MAGVEARAQLAAKSPFIPAAGAAPTAPAAEQPLEFRGYMETSEGRRYRIYDPAKKAGFWVSLNEAEKDLGVVAKQHDADQNTLAIEYQGRSLTLAMRKAKVVSSGNAAAMPLPVAGPVQSTVPLAVTQAVVLNPTPADEQRRLDAVAAEVARRRALREQAAQQPGPGAPQVVPAPATTPGAGTPPAGQNYVSPTTQFGTPGRPTDPVSPR